MDLMEKKIGLVGIGKLGTAMMQHWSKHNQRIGVYHPNKLKAERFIQTFPNGHFISEHEIGELDVVILALAAKDIIPFLTELITKKIPLTDTYIINMATAFDTKKIQHQFPELQVAGVKYMGHAKDLLDHGNGLFITESTLPQEVEELFRSLGPLRKDREDLLIEVNRLATYYAIQAAVEIESQFLKREYCDIYIQRALTSIAPEVIRSYIEGTLGHFAKEIAKEIKAKEKK